MTREKKTKAQKRKEETTNNKQLRESKKEVKEGNKSGFTKQRIRPLSASKGKKVYATEEKEEIINKIEAALVVGYARAAACNHIGFPLATLHLWEQNDLSLQIRLNQAVVKTSFQAREKIVQRIREGHIQTCQWWLEKKEPESFNTRYIIEHGGKLGLDLTHKFDLSKLTPDETKAFTEILQRIVVEPTP